MYFFFFSAHVGSPLIGKRIEIASDKENEQMLKNNVNSFKKYFPYMIAGIVTLSILALIVVIAVHRRSSTLSGRAPNGAVRRISDPTPSDQLSEIGNLIDDNSTLLPHSPPKSCLELLPNSPADDKRMQHPNSPAEDQRSLLPNSSGLDN